MTDSWISTSIGEQVTLQRGFDITKAQQRSGKVPVISSGGVSSFHDTATAKGPGVILGRKGVVGSVFYIEEDYWPHDTSLWVKDFHGNYPRFIYYFFKSISEKLQKLDVGSANPTLNRNHVHPIPVKWPPLNEQKKIALVLGMLDDKIELNRRMNVTLEAMARALFQSWFVDFDPVRAKLDGRKPAGMDDDTAALFPSEFQDSELGPIPKGWKIGKIKDCCIQIQNGGTPKRNEPQFWEEGDIPWLTSGEVRQSIITSTQNFITEKGLVGSSAKWIPEFSTLIALYGATAGEVSLTSVKLTTNQAVCALIPRDGFAFFNFLSMERQKSELKNKAVGSAQQNISKAIVEETTLVLPDLDVIGKFFEIMTPLFEFWVSNLNQIVLLAQIRDSLLPRLLSGEISLSSEEVKRAVNA
jgi:type I restriction enzyme S subunit